MPPIMSIANKEPRRGVEPRFSDYKSEAITIILTRRDLFGFDVDDWLQVIKAFISWPDLGVLIE